MDLNEFGFTKIRDVKSPIRAHDFDAGIDFFVPNDFAPTSLGFGESILIPGGLKVKIPNGHALIFFNKSGVAAKRNLVLGSCVVDANYQGELLYNLHNIGDCSQMIEPGEKIVQGIILPINFAKVTEYRTEDDLYNGVVTDRGSGGFGSTGVN